jgi:hypothetical protein
VNVLPRTYVYDVVGGQRLADYPELMIQVKLGADFYVGQVPYVVKELTHDQHGNLLVYIERKAR